MATDKKLFGRWDDIPPQAFFWATVILIAIPYMYPLGTPLILTDYTKGYFTALTEVPQGGTVVMSLDSAMGGIIETGGAMAVTTKYFVTQRPDVKLIIWGMHYDAPLVYDSIMVPILKDLEYGVNYIYFGYLPGGEAAVAKLADDPKGMLRFDFSGNSVEQYPIMDDLNNADDVDLVAYYSTGLVGGYIGHWFERYGTKIVGTGLAGGITTATMQIDAGQLIGFAAGVRGSAELEQIAGFPSFATSTLDALNVMNLFIIVILILANVVYYGWQRPREGK